VQFLARGLGGSLFLTATEAVLVLAGPAAAPSGATAQGPTEALAVVEGHAPAGPSAPGAVVRMQILGGNTALQAVGLEQLPGQVNYLLGNDPSRWHTHIPTYAQVAYRDVYPGIDLIYHGQQQLEYDFVVAPGADPRTIQLGFVGADHLAVDPNGDLVLDTAGQVIRQHQPFVYQEVHGVRQAIPARFVLEDGQRVGFAVAGYDPSQPLVVDPVVSYATYLGGSGQDSGEGIAVDSTGAAYVTGQTSSPDFPTANAFQPDLKAAANAFVTKFSPDGSSLAYSTYLGGTCAEIGHAIAVNADGNAYVTGTTFSPDFPVTPGAFQTTFGGSGCTFASNAFVTQLNADGSALVYSSFLSGRAMDDGYGIALDDAGDAYLAGGTDSTNFPTVNPLQGSLHGSSNAFVSKVNPDGSALLFSTYLGGSRIDDARGIAVDGAGNAIVAGSTDSTDFPTVAALQPAEAGNFDAYVAKLTSDGSALIYSTYLGGSYIDYALGVAADADGNAYVLGWTESSDFPTTPDAFQTTLRGQANAYVAKLDPAGSALVYSTYLGGREQEIARGIAVDAAGNAYVTGYTRSADFPTVDSGVDLPSGLLVADGLYHELAGLGQLTPVDQDIGQVGERSSQSARVVRHVGEVGHELLLKIHGLAEDRLCFGEPAGVLQQQAELIMDRRLRLPVAGRRVEIVR
jgi:hypothetical protein